MILHSVAKVIAKNHQEKIKLPGRIIFLSGSTDVKKVLGHFLATKFT